MTRRLIAGMFMFVALIGIMLIEGPSEAQAGRRHGCHASKRCHGGRHHNRCHGGWRAKRDRGCCGAYAGCNGYSAGYATSCSGSHSAGYGETAPAPVPNEGPDARDGAVPPPPALDPSATPAPPSGDQPAAPAPAGPAA